MKLLNFETLVEKIAEHEKAFGEKTTQSNVEIIFLAQKDKKQTNDSSRGESGRRGHGKIQFIGKGSRHNQGERPYCHCTHFNRDGHEAQYCQIPW